MFKFLLTSIFVLFPITIFSQHVREKYIQVLEIGEKEVYTYFGDTLMIDTLKMYNESKLSITNSPTCIIVNRAYILGQATFDASGENGEDGKDGQLGFLGQSGVTGGNGNDVSLYVHFEKLDAFNLVTKGGNGGAGGRGGAGSEHRAAPGQPGGDGKHGGACGNGGNGGNINFHYSTSGFTPVFNRKKGLSKINLDASGGAKGRRGRGGQKQLGGEGEIMRDNKGQIIMQVPAGADGRDGRSGSGCNVGQEGEIVIKKWGFNNIR